MIASHKRSIKPGTQYNKYFDLGSVDNHEVTLAHDGDVVDTVRLMQRIVQKTLPQTKKIAQVLKGATRQETSRNLWNFLYHHVQYTTDHPLREQLRTPLRTWRDRAKGVDCDCYSIFISSVLTNLGIPHQFRIAAYGGSDFQHVYVVVPNGKNYITIDPVLNQFNTEQPYARKKDFDMHITQLSGPGLGSHLAGCPPRNTALSPGNTAVLVTSTPARPEEKRITLTPARNFFGDGLMPEYMRQVEMKTDAAPAPKPEIKTASLAPQLDTPAKVALSAVAIMLLLAAAGSSKKSSGLSGPRPQPVAEHTRKLTIIHI